MRHTRSSTETTGRPPTAGQFILENLRDDILTGQLPAGAPLLLDDLAGRFGTSVIPIREALRRLEAERLVVLRPHRTAQVAELSLAELKDLYFVRLLVEPEAVRLAHDRLAAPDYAELRRLTDDMERHALADDDLMAFEIHAELHFLIYRAAGSPALLGIVERLWDETERYRHAVKHYRSDARTWATEHRHLIGLLEGSDVDASVEEMRAHLTRTLNALCAARRFEAERRAAGGGPETGDAATHP